MYLNLIFTVLEADKNMKYIIFGLILEIAAIVTVKGGPYTAWNAMLTTRATLCMYTQEGLFCS